MNVWRWGIIPKIAGQHWRSRFKMRNPFRGSSWRSAREWTTLILVIITTLTVIWQAIISRNALSVGQRAFVGVKGFGQMSIIQANSTGKKHVAIPVIWANNGNSQAETLKIHGSCSKTTPWEADEGKWYVSKWSLSPKIEWSHIECWPKVDELKDYKNGRFLYVFGQATYKDRTPGNERDEYVTRFCARLSTFREFKGPLGDRLSFRR